jgi:hypothetical protein
MIFIDMIKANAEISRLTKELAEVKADRDLQLGKITEFETKSKEFIESVQTTEQVKETHKQEKESLVKEYEQKLADKDKELASHKETSAKEISTVKQSVAEETIKLVASQGTNVVIETVLPKEEHNGEKQPKYKFTVIPQLKK